VNPESGPKGYGCALQLVEVGAGEHPGLAAALLQTFADAVRAIPIGCHGSEPSLPLETDRP